MMKVQKKSCWIFLLVTVTYLGDMLRGGFDAHQIDMIFVFSIALDSTLYTFFAPSFSSRTQIMPTEESLRPFPWPRNTKKDQGEHCEVKPHDADCNIGGNVSKPTPFSSFGSIDSTVKASTENFDGLDFLQYMLPPPGATAGKVLHHVKSAMVSLFSKYDPMIFKIGYSHNPMWRWANNLYGYKFDKANKWTNMVVLYESTEPFGPAMLEASLIDIYKSILSTPILC